MQGLRSYVIATPGRGRLLTETTSCLSGTLAISKSCFQVLKGQASLALTGTLRERQRQRGDCVSLNLF